MSQGEGGELEPDLSLTGVSSLWHSVFESEPGSAVLQFWSLFRGHKRQSQPPRLGYPPRGGSDRVGSLGVGIGIGIGIPDRCVCACAWRTELDMSGRSSSVLKKHDGRRPGADWTAKFRA